MATAVEYFKLKIKKKLAGRYSQNQGSLIYVTNLL